MTKKLKICCEEMRFFGNDSGYFIDANGNVRVMYRRLGHEDSEE